MEAEAVLVSVIQKLGSWRVEMPLYLNTLKKSDTLKLEEKMGSWQVQTPFYSKARKKADILNIEKRMNGIMSELRMILDFLRDNKVGYGRSSSRRINYLICDILHMAHDALLLYKIENIRNFVKQMDPLLRWLTEVKSRLFKLGVDGAEEGEEELSNRLLKYINVGEGDEDEYVVGFKKDVQLLLRDYIFADIEYNSVFYINGTVGSGKTALARQLFNHKDVVDKFECRAWVCVSTDLTCKQLLMKLVQQLVDSEELQSGALLEKIESADNTSLQEMLRQHLQGKRYFIILDDLRHQMPLESIIHYLPKEVKGSRLLLTMRNDDAQLFERSNNVHMMSYLDSDESWELFFKTISCNNQLTSEQKFPKQLQRKGKSMLRKCGGLPLAIKLVGRQSVERRQSGTEWEEILESFDLGPILELLEPTYLRLNPTTKSCFLHFSFFKENASIKAYKLMQILHAGTAVLKRNAGRGALFELKNRESIIEIMYSEVCSKFKSCRINSLFHALSIKKAEEEFGLEIVRNNGNYRPSQNPRHRVISSYCRDEFNYSTNQDHRHIISLFFHGGGYFDDSSSYWETFEELRILDMDGYGIKVLPEAIDRLIELRYLGLRNNYIRELPSSLWCLINLETVDIAQNYMMEVPDIIWEMYSLRHLYMSGIICRRPLKIDTLKYLRSFAYISLDNWTYDKSGLEMMTKLEKLGIEELDVHSNVSKLFTSLSKLYILRTLILRGFRFKSMPCLDELHVLRSLSTLKLGGLLPRLPSVDNFPPYIEYLKLYDSCLGEDPIPILERLSSLRFLKLRNAYTGKQMVISCDGFPMLEHLHLTECWNLRNVQVREDGMPNLSQFKIKNCPYLKNLPKDMPSSVKVKVVIEM